MSSISTALREVLQGVDEDTLQYFEAMVGEEEELDEQQLTASLAPFLEEYGISSGEEESRTLVGALCERLRGMGVADAKEEEELKLLERVTVMDQDVVSGKEKAVLDSVFGFDQIRKSKNTTIEVNEAGSAKYERRAAKEQKKWLDDLDSKFADEDEDSMQISSMVLPDLNCNTNEKDIHVSNFNITFGGKLLLENAALRLVYGRRYGLVGRNGIGKTTLLRHMATFDIEGFPRHHRVLHVKQEVKSTDDTVLQVVLNSDVERNELLSREKELLRKQDGSNGKSIEDMQEIEMQLRQVYERMTQIGADDAEARASSILTGLQFTEEMQSKPTKQLSGGWLMRVALAGALFIEPDLLMLDEPTNHLDLEAVLWLEEYLQSYKKTILLVSHDRAFLNDICTDIILLKDLKLTYYKGNYDAFEETRKEALLVQQRTHEAQVAKVQHMQEFVDRFRYNAKKASLVQSRIKAIEREQVVDEVVDDTDGFKFVFEDCGKLGRPVIQLQDVTFGYDPKKEPLFRGAEFGIDQESRIALVGPNGAGKSTLLKLIMGQLTPQSGYISVNPKLRIGIFTQHHLDSFDLRLSALENMSSRWPLSKEQELRSHLGKYEICGNDALKPLKFTSGGQKSRVAFACLTFSKPHVVLLDEPTNHLDMESINALIGALQDFTGGVLVISHDQFFIKQLCNEIWVVKDKKVTKFSGDIDNYKKMTIAGKRGKR